MTQVGYRTIEALGLISAYNNKWLKYTFGLTILDPNEVSHCFVEDWMSKIPDDSKFHKYAYYLVDNYVGENSIWVAFTVDLTRTTNNCAFYHAHFNEQFY